jgi:multidrug efflux pump subunit AcrA (membrane-fusion protein)
MIDSPMMRLTALCFVTALLAAARAGEVTVESRPFTIETTFDATAMPDKGCVPLRFDPTSGSNFVILEIARHGSRVAKGDVLVRCDTTDIDRRIASLRQSLPNTPAADAADNSSLQQNKETLAALEADRAQCEMKAPADGWFYHGLVENGRWTPGDTKPLCKHGRPAVNLPFATFIPASAKTGWVASLDEAAARSLAPGCSGIATLAGREDLEIPVKLAKLATAPAPDGTWRVDLTATWPKDFTPVVGINARLHLIAYHRSATIVIPNSALAYGPQGWSVEVKLADGKSECRPVKRGRAAHGDTEILDGLEVGQVVLTP